MPEFQSLPKNIVIWRRNVWYPQGTYIVATSYASLNIRIEIHKLSVKECL